MMLPIAVVPTEDGKSVVAAADPVGQVWLYGEPDLTKDPGSGQEAAARGVRGALERRP